MKSRKLIVELFNNGRSFSNGPLKGLYIIDRDSQSSLKCGFTVSSRSFKKAVDRNRIKRLMREAYRTQKNELQAVVNNSQIALAVFIIFRGQELPDYKTIYDKMGEIVSKLLKLAVETTPQNT